MDFQINGTEIIVKELNDLSTRAKAYAFRAHAKALKTLLNECQRLLSEDDHSLKALADMGHPYGFTNPRTIHDPDETTHEQSGDLLRALRAQYPQGFATEILSGAIVNDDPLDRWIQEGTTLMRARPYMKYVEEHFGQQVSEYIISEIMRAMKDT